MSLFIEDIWIDRGADWVSPIYTWSYGAPNDVPPVAAVPVDLTNCTARFQILPSPDVTGTPLFAMTNSTGITLGGVAGTIVWGITKAQSLALNHGDFPYVLWIDFTATSKSVKLRSGIAHLAP